MVDTTPKLLIEPRDFPASYVVYFDAARGLYRAKACFAGGTDYNDTILSTVFNNAATGLSAGRTWKEKIHLKGNLTVDGNLSVPSFTTVEIDGQLKVPNGQNLSSGILTLQASATDVEIRGGIIDGNANNQTANGAHGVLLGNANARIKLLDVKIQNIYKAFGTYLPGNLSDILIRDCWYDNIGGSAIASDISNGGTNANVRIIRPIITRYAQQSFGGSFDAIHTEAANTRWLCAGGDIDGTGALQNGYGINFSSVTEGRITKNRVYKSRLDGIVVAASNYVKVHSNHCELSGQAASAGYQSGIRVDDAGITPASTYCSICLNTLVGNLGNAAVEKGTANHNDFSHNTLVSNGAGVVTTGVNTQNKDNVT